VADDGASFAGKIHRLPAFPIYFLASPGDREMGCIVARSPQRPIEDFSGLAITGSELLPKTARHVAIENNMTLIWSVRAASST
jgi:hypothetical protein